MKIRTRLILVVLLAAFLTLSLFSILQIKYQYDRDYHQFTDKIEYYDRLLSGFMRLPLWNLDRASIEVGLDGLITEPDISNIDVKDTMGLIRVIREKSGTGPVVKHLVTIYGDSTVIGYIEVSYQANILVRNTRDATFAYVSMGISLLLVLGCVLILAAWSITRPLYRIINMVQDIGKHSLANQPDLSFKGELADLARSISQMADDLREREITIQQVSAESAASEMKLRMEQELRRLSDAHREALQNSLETLQQARQQLITSEKMALLGSLVAGVSHEINTPIGVSVTAASYLQDKTREFVQLINNDRVSKGKLDLYVRTIDESLHLVLSNLERAATLIRSFKQVSVDQASESQRNFDLCAYINEVIRSLHPSLRNKELDIRISCPDNLIINSYPGVFSQILTNLIINSLIHGFYQRDQGIIRIEVSPLASGDLRIFYADDGRGMTESALTHLFEPFFTSMRNDGGSGLGSYIVYNLVTQTLKGSIRGENAPGGGLQYVIEIPMAETPADPP